MSVFAKEKRHLVFIFGIIIIISLLFGGNLIYAADRNVAAVAPPVQVIINGENYSDNHSSKDAKPLLVQNNTYLPIRAIAEQVGIPILWVPESKSVYIGDLSLCPNPLLQNLGKTDQTPAFEKIKPEHFIPAIEYAMAAERQQITEIIQNPEAPNFTNTIEALERITICDEISNILIPLNSAESNDALQKAAMDADVLLSNHNNDIFFNKALFAKVALVYRQSATENLTDEERTLLENTYGKFIDNGINLSEKSQQKLRETDARLAVLSNRFSENILTNTNTDYLLITDKKELSGLPDNLVEGAAAEAKSRGMEGWCFTMDYPTISAFLTLGDDREKRKEILKKYRTLGMLTPETDNREIVKEFVNLRLQKAELLGFSNYADYVLKERMVKNTQTVTSFLDALVSKALPAAQANIKELEEYAQSKGHIGSLETYDVDYYENKLHQEKYSFDEEALRPYFEINQVKSGVFQLVKQLYGLRIVPNEQIQVYHPDVEAYDVFDENDRFMGVLYLDFFCREGKGAGAWANVFRMQEKRNGEDIRPLVNLVYNFPSPSENGLSLLSFYDVQTFLHEFGHGLQALLSDVNYASLSSFGDVSWDFVELPSTIMENWAYEKDFLRLFAKDYRTGKSLPDKTIDDLNKMRTIHNAYRFLAQIKYSTLDMAWHTVTKPVATSVDNFENQCLSRLNVIPPIQGTLTSPIISHLFGGGYDAGYYGYLWSDALSADAYQVFKENGIMNRKSGKAFCEKVLSKGATIDPLVLYKNFVGREPSVDALLKQEGLQ